MLFTSNFATNNNIAIAVDNVVEQEEDNIMARSIPNAGRRKGKHHEQLNFDTVLADAEPTFELLHSEFGSDDERDGLDGGGEMDCCLDLLLVQFCLCRELSNIKTV